MLILKEVKIDSRSTPKYTFLPRLAVEITWRYIKNKVEGKTFYHCLEKCHHNER